MCQKAVPAQTLISSPSFVRHHLVPRVVNITSKCGVQSPFRTYSPCLCLSVGASSTTGPILESPTPLTPIRFRGRTIFVKRDDTLSFAGVTGSKLRKLYSLFISEELDNYDSVVSYGGAQSNAMLALARLCRYRRKSFVYVTRPVSARLRETPGNFYDALSAHMYHIELDLQSYRDLLTDVPQHVARRNISTALLSHSLPFATARPYFVPQGGAWDGAEPGVALLAAEVRDQISQLRAAGVLANKIPILFLPCGTGTTAFFLQKHLVDVVRVVAVPVSGSELYLIKQMRWLHSSIPAPTSSLNAPIFPCVIRPRLRGSFADIRPDKMRIWMELCRATDGEFEFDLIYAPKAWEEVMLAVEQGRIAQNGEDIIYYHTGGVEGNISMLGTFMSLSSSFSCPQYMSGS